MSEALVKFISTHPGDSAEFVDIVRALAVGIARDHQPARLYVIRIDNWFGPRWLYFSGKVLGQLGVYKNEVSVPPFVPHRVLAERVFAGPSYEETVATSPLHIDCKSSEAVVRRIAEIDRDAAFVWFSGESEGQKRGSVMIYLPISSNDSGFYVGFSHVQKGWEPVMLRGVSRSEIAYVEERGRGLQEPNHA